MTESAETDKMFSADAVHARQMLPLTIICVMQYSKEIQMRNTPTTRRFPSGHRGLRRLFAAARRIAPETAQDPAGVSPLARSLRDRLYVLARAGAAALVVLSAVIGTTVTTSGTGQAATPRPCDIYASGRTPCVAAYSTTRSLFASYKGPLYQVQRSSDGRYLNVGLLSAGGYANAAAQVSFCSGTQCTITKIYDQTANHNDMPISWGGSWKGSGPNGSDIGADAMALPVTIAGHQAFGIKVTPGAGYRIDHGKGVATDSQPEGMYMVTSSNYVNGECCFDFGNAETSHNDAGNAHMDAVYWGTICWLGGCPGSGPWVAADLENGLYQTNTGSNKHPSNSGVHYPFVSAWLKNNGVSNFALKYGNGSSGGLTTPWSGPLPNGYSPMRKEGSVMLGTGGDNSNSGVGEFFEGAMTAGFPSDTTENSVQANITAAGYGR